MRPRSRPWPSFETALARLLRWVWSAVVGKDTRSHSHGVFSPEVYNSLSLSPSRGRRESRALTAPASPCAEGRERKHTGLTGTAETTRLSPRNGFTAYTRSPRGSGLSCPRCRRNICFRQRSARVAAPGPHDFAVRCKRFVRHANMPDVCASIASQAHDDRDAPLRWV
jgi:hypothetical protein